jgi:protocatechuate 3,4-dioxygenase beta subunit
MDRLNRRRFIGLSAWGAAAAFGAPMRIVGSWSSSLGSLPSRIRIAPASEPGERLVLTGRVVGADGAPRAGIEIDAYHTDAKGLYRPDGGTPAWPARPPRLEGRLSTAADGSYEIDSIRPGPYPGGGNPAHIHFHLRTASIDQGETLWFEGDPQLSPEQIRREAGLGRFSAIQPLVRDGAGVWRCVRDFRLRDGAAR